MAKASYDMVKIACFQAGQAEMAALKQKFSLFCDVRHRLLPGSCGTNKTKEEKGVSRHLCDAGAGNT